MSEPIPESIPTSTSHRSGRPTKKTRTDTPTSQQSAHVEALFANPDREITLPPSSTNQTKAQKLAAPPEIVANVQGSSAGAGSGEFHVYKASRRREYERLRLMDEEVEKEEREKEFRGRKEEMKAKDEETLAKNREKRAKAKARKEKKEKGGASGVEKMDVDKAEPGKRKLGAAKVALPQDGVREDTEEDADLGGVMNGNGNPEAVEEGGIRFVEDD